eukprot:TRINITY_DN72805_c0_g1_i1.p1 TRINITY_DN72805_c0_g1~~TRINITY_DN72805_c0_g1_i1.p1  ORF type:complete len:417 (+),score=160.20 TRINITY_DN72805_c0_g1_i1:25-1251(+)
MGKKKGAKRGGDEEEDFRSQESDFSGKQSGHHYDDGEEEEKDQFERLVELLGSRTQADRDQALKELRVFMHANPDVAGEYNEAGADMGSAISRCVRNGSGSQALALQVAQLAVVFYSGEEVGPELSESMAILACFIYKNDTSTSEEVCESIRLLTVCHLTNPVLDLNGDDVVDLLYQVWNANAKSYPIEAFAEAISCWVVCMTMADMSGHNSELEAFFKEGQKMVNLVGNIDYDISCAALEGIGLMYEAAGKAIGRPPPGLGKKDPDALLESVLSESDKSVKKTQRKSRKDLVRRVQTTIENPDVDMPTTRITVGPRKLEFEGWTRVLQLDFLRDILLSGMTEYLKHNESIRSILNISHLNLGASIDKRDRKEERKALAESARERGKQKTMSDHKKSSAKLRSRFADE